MALLKDLGKRFPLAMWSLHNMHYRPRNQSQKYRGFSQVAAQCEHNLGPQKKSWLPGCILVAQSQQSFLGGLGQQSELSPNWRVILCHHTLSSEAHQSWELSHKLFTPSWCFQSNLSVNKTPRIKGGLNNKAFIIAQIIGRQFMGWWHGDWKKPTTSVKWKQCPWRQTFFASHQ